MMKQPSLEELEKGIEALYDKTDSSRNELLVEDFLHQKLKGLSSGERLDLLEKLVHHFEQLSPDTRRDALLESKVYSRIFTLLLDGRISVTKLSSLELLEKLAQSLNTIFDTLNQIIRVIHTTLFGQNVEIETIRHIIGANLERGDKEDSLQSYLNQIREAFLVTHEAFKQSFQSKVAEILTEIDPDHIAANFEGGLRFGPLRKAELFEIYKEKFSKLKRWFESGRFIDELLREFEKRCQKLYTIQH